MRSQSQKYRQTEDEHLSFFRCIYWLKIAQLSKYPKMLNPVLQPSQREALPETPVPADGAKAWAWEGLRAWPGSGTRVVRPPGF